METGEWGLVQLFGYDKEIKLNPPPPDTSDDEFEYEIPKEQIRIYEDQVSRSGGFDVAAITIPDDADLFGGLIQPLNTNCKYWDFDSYSQLAVDEYNRRFEEDNRALEFVKVLKAMGMPSCLFIFYITFEAKDLADGGKIKAYQAKVSQGIADDDISVSSFRLKPDDHEQEGSGNHRKEWFWEDRLI